ncbi:MAG TPA: Maf family protein [Candidatus Saccharimonadales bacterium]|nr:Maf family protein [Candidatus Saccharimonadales bacterium]
MLASGSPRRRQLLDALGVPYLQASADIDERAADHPALAKAEHLAERGIVTLAADTMIELGTERLGKPADRLDATEMLRALAGRRHIVRTEVAVVGAAGRRLWFGVRSTVTMRPRDDAAIATYVASGEPLDKAGSYALQGAGAALVESYGGCYSNIVGLPLCHAFAALRKMGVAIPTRPEEAFENTFGFTCPAAAIARSHGRSLRSAVDYDSFP